jgi:hypothetical protein
MTQMEVLNYQAIALPFRTTRQQLAEAQARGSENTDDDEAEDDSVVQCPGQDVSDQGQ